MIAASLLATALLAAQPRLAVLDVRAGVGISPELARGLGDALTHEVRRRNPGVDVVGATEIRSMLEVQREKSKLGCQDVSCLAEIGGALGAERLVTAGLNKFGDTYLFTVQLVDVRRARVLRDSQEKLSGNNQSELLAVVERAVAEMFPEETRADEIHANANPSRISLIYDPEIPLTNGTLAAQDIVHSIGVELSLPTGRSVRYHLQIAYVNTNITGGNVSGFRIDPLTFGWVFPLVVQGDFRLEVEPTVSFLDFAALFPPSNGNFNTSAAVFFSSGVGAQLNLGYGPLYAFVSPLGLEFRYLAIDGSGNVTGGADLAYRLRFGLGFQY
jgi:hypothetical protein